VALRLERQYRWRKKLGTVTRKTAIAVSDALLINFIPVASTLVVTFDQPVILSGFPATWSQIGGAGAGQVPIAAALTAADEVTLTFPAGTLGASGLAIGPYDPSIRTKTGGYASPDAFTI